ncbi:MAG: DUF3575 domain-containing protein [Tannerellaceae bacterium]
MLFLLVYKAANAQRVAVSSNLVGLGLLSANLEGEIGLNHQSTLAVNTSCAPWKITDKLSLRHLSIVPEYRYWFKQSMYAHYVGVNALYCAYNINISHKRYVGNTVGLGLGYGYSFVVGERWNVVPGIGVGVGWNNRRSNSESIPKISPILTRLGISIQYLIY